MRLISINGAEDFPYESTVLSATCEGIIAYCGKRNAYITYARTIPEAFAQLRQIREAYAAGEKVYIYEPEKH